MVCVRVFERCGAVFTAQVDARSAGELPHVCAATALGQGGSESCPCAIVEVSVRNFDECGQVFFLLRGRASHLHVGKTSLVLSS